MQQISTLICKSDLQVGLKCLKSLQAYYKEPFEFLIYDDGSLEESDILLLKRNLSPCLVITKRNRDEIVRDHLANYPACQKFRKQNVLAQKLFDISLLNPSEVITFCDSDVLFLKPFTGLNSALNAEVHAVFTQDAQPAVSLSWRQLMQRSSPKLARNINSGFFVFEKKYFDLPALEYLLNKYADTKSFLRAACWAEQTCWALLAHKANSSLWDRAQIGIAGNFMKQNLRIDHVAMHFVSSYRLLLDNYASQSFSNENLQELRVNKNTTLKWQELMLCSVQRKFGKVV